PERSGSSPGCADSSGDSPSARRRPPESLEPEFRSALGPGSESGSAPDLQSRRCRPGPAPRRRGTWPAPTYGSIGSSKERLLGFHTGRWRPKSTTSWECIAAPSATQGGIAPGSGPGNRLVTRGRMRGKLPGVPKWSPHEDPVIRSTQEDPMIASPLRLTLTLGLVAAALAACSDDDDGPTGPEAGGISCAENSATYTLTFQSVWSAQTHPEGFPSNPHFSGLIGATHRATVSFWDPESLASPGIQAMAELGRKSPLDEEVQAAIDS